MEGIESVVKALNRQHVTMSALQLVVGLLVLMGLGGLYLHTMQSYQRVLGKAEEREAAYMARFERLEEKWAADRTRIEELTKNQAQAQTRIVYRDREADKRVAEVLAPSRPAEQVRQDLQSAYSFGPLTVEGNLFTFDTPQVQQFVATKVDRDRLAENLKDTQGQLHDEQEKVNILEANLGEAQGSLKEAQGVIDGYKKAAKKSKWQRFFDGAKKVGLFVGGIAIGKALGG